MHHCSLLGEGHVVDGAVDLRFQDLCETSVLFLVPARFCLEGVASLGKFAPFSLALALNVLQSESKVADRALQLGDLLPFALELLLEASDFSIIVRD